MKFIVTVLLCLFTGLGIAAQTGKSGENVKPDATIMLAREDSEGNIIENVKIFSPKDIPIYCYLNLASANVVTVKVSFVAVKVKGIRPNSAFINISYKTREGDNHLEFTGRPPKSWSVGDYRVDVFINGKISVSEEFSVESTDTK